MGLFSERVFRAVDDSIQDGHCAFSELEMKMQSRSHVNPSRNSGETTSQHFHIGIRASAFETHLGRFYVR